MAVEYGFSVDLPNDAGTVRYEPGATSDDMVQPTPNIGARINPSPRVLAYGQLDSSLTLGSQASMTDEQLYESGAISWFEYQFRRLTGLSGVGDAAAVLGGVAAAVTLYTYARQRRGAARE